MAASSSPSGYSQSRSYLRRSSSSSTDSIQLQQAPSSGPSGYSSTSASASGEAASAAAAAAAAAAANSSVGSISFASTSTLVPNTSTSAPQYAITGGTAQASWRDLFLKRIASLVYLKAVMSGKQPYASLVVLSSRNLQAIYAPDRVRKRTFRHLVLGLALSQIAELESLPDLAKGLLAALTDVEALPENAGATVGSVASESNSGGTLASSRLSHAAEKKGVRGIFSNKSKSKRGPFPDFLGADALGGGIPSAGLPGNNSVEFLASMKLPFALDFLQTFFTLADTLVEVYSKLLILIGAVEPSANPPTVSQTPTQRTLSNASQQANSATSPHFKKMNLTTLSAANANGGQSNMQRSPLETGSTFWGQQGGPSTGPPPPAGPLSPTSTLTSEMPGIEQDMTSASASPMKHSTSGSAVTPPVADLLGKADGKVKKILTQIVKELDAAARHVVKEELKGFQSNHVGVPWEADGSASGRGVSLGSVRQRKQPLNSQPGGVDGQPWPSVGAAMSRQGDSSQGAASAEETQQQQVAGSGVPMYPSSVPTVPSPLSSRSSVPASGIGSGSGSGKRENDVMTVLHHPQTQGVGGAHSQRLQQQHHQQHLHSDG